MEIILVTDENINTLRAEWGALDQRDALEVGDSVWRTRDVHGVISADGTRAGVATNGRTMWGDVKRSGETVFKIACDEGGCVDMHGEDLCEHEGCDARGTEHGEGGVLLCAEHEAKSHEWVVLEDLHAARWMDARRAQAMERELAKHGWSVEIRSPRHTEAEGVHLRPASGVLQIQMHPPQVLREALERAWNAIERRRDKRQGARARRANQTARSA